jgi:hypothetical protein
MKFEEKIVPTISSIFISDFSEYRPLLELSKIAIFEEKIKDKGESLNSNVRASYVTSYFAHENNEKFTPLIDLVTKTANDIIYEKDKANIQFRCLNAWGMEYLSGDYALPHRHFRWAPSYSAVCYIDVDDDCAPIIFENNTFIQPKSNMFILFPASVLHYVPKTKGNRILMSYNLV